MTSTDNDDESDDGDGPDDQKIRDRSKGLLNQESLMRFHTRFLKPQIGGRQKDIDEKKWRRQTLEVFEPMKEKKEQGGLLKVFSKLQRREDTEVVNYNDELSDKYGSINYYGLGFKQIRDTQKFHDRLVVIRGADIYWYRVEDRIMKKKQTIPAKPISTCKVGNYDCFIIQRDDNDPNS